MTNTTPEDMAYSAGKREGQEEMQQQLAQLRTENEELKRQVNRLRSDVAELEEQVVMYNKAEDKDDE